MAALAAAAAENPAPPHDAAVAAAGFRRTGVQGAKCVHDVVERNWLAALRRRACRICLKLSVVAIVIRTLAIITLVTIMFCYVVTSFFDWTSA